MPLRGPLDTSSESSVASRGADPACVLGVIVARGGSKRLPGKNLRQLGDKPLIAWTAEAARDAGSLTHVIVSTDSRDIAEISEKYGVSVPFMRPPHLAEDKSNVLDALSHAVVTMDGKGIRADVVVLLQATSPFRSARDIDEAVGLLIAKGADTVLSVRPAREHPYWMWRDKKGEIVPLFSREHMALTREAVPPMFMETGALYVVRRSVLDCGSLYGDRVVPIQLSNRAAIDIDDESDFVRAERTLATSE
jgi:CMP-N-acetylneuraminic acid synthetase